MTDKQETRYECRFCHKVFVREGRYIEHKCQLMKRHEEIKTPDGQTGYNLYQLWLRKQNRMPPPIASFLTSKYFRTFINFAKFVRSVSLPMPEKFIWLMVERKFSPSLWTSDEVYANYMEFVDHKIPPLDQVKTSITTLIKITDKHESDISNAFSIIPAYEIIHLVRTRMLSPWLLLFSSKFKKLFATGLTSEEKIILESLIRPSFWMAQFEKHPEIVTKIKQYVKELEV